MRILRLLLLSSLVTVALTASAAAGPITVDFGTLTAPPGSNTNVGTSETLGPITAYGYYYDTTTNTWTGADLIARQQPNDNGLGVCSPGENTSPGNCEIGTPGGGGDYNELSQLTNQEAILLSISAAYDWAELWVSSLDSGGVDTDAGGPDTSNEAGRVCWGNTSNVATLLTGSCFNFSYGDFGTSVEGNILGLGAASGFDVTAAYVLFIPNGSLTDNNDYLVWGATLTQPEFDVPVPEPASLTLLGVGLGAARLLRRRQRR